MRTIKFRVWNPKYKSWCGKDKGDWWLGLEYNTGKLVCIVDGNIKDAPDYLITQMFTGLLDKNGKEIYEDDFVTSESHLPEVMRVEFIEGAFCMTHSTIDDYPIDINHFYPSIGTDLVVIGNVYENPDLSSNN